MSRLIIYSSIHTRELWFTRMGLSICALIARRRIARSKTTTAACCSENVWKLAISGSRCTAGKKSSLISRARVEGYRVAGQSVKCRFDWLDAYLCTAYIIHAWLVICEAIIFNEWLLLGRFFGRLSLSALDVLFIIQQCVHLFCYFKNTSFRLVASILFLKEFKRIICGRVINTRK